MYMRLHRYLCCWNMELVADAHPSQLPNPDLWQNVLVRFAVAHQHLIKNAFGMEPQTHMLKQCSQLRCLQSNL